MRARRQPLIRPAQAARASPRCSSPTRTSCCSTSSAGGVNPTLIKQPARRTASGTSTPTQQDDPRGRAQHGVRDGHLLAHHRAQPGRNADGGRARGGSLEPGGARGIPRRRRGRGSARRDPPGAGGSRRRRRGLGRGRTAARRAARNQHHAGRAAADAEGSVCRLRWRGHPQAGVARGPGGGYHLCRRPQRRRQVDGDEHDQRIAAPASRGRSGFRGELVSGLRAPARCWRAGSRRSRRHTACSRT